jgi:hypothetical protein
MNTATRTPPTPRRPIVKRPVSQPTTPRYICPTCGGELIAHRSEIVCLDCPSFVPVPCQSQRTNGPRR